MKTKLDLITYLLYKVYRGDCMTLNERVLEKIENYKIKNNLKYSEIAEKLGISKYSFANMRHNWENNKCSPSGRIFDRIMNL